VERTVRHHEAVEVRDGRADRDAVGDRAERAGARRPVEDQFVTEACARIR
jgi:hypothetical protein